MKNVTSEKRMINSDELQQLTLWRQWAIQIARFQNKQLNTNKAA